LKEISLRHFFVFFQFVTVINVKSPDGSGGENGEGGGESKRKSSQPGSAGAGQPPRFTFSKAARQTFDIEEINRGGRRTASGQERAANTAASWSGHQREGSQESLNSVSRQGQTLSASSIG
jgi:hypothetical protein